MRIPREAIWLLAVFFLQSLPGVSGWGLDLPLILVTLVSLRTTAAKATAWGFFVGLAQDLLSAGWIGPNTVAKTLTGLLSFLSRMHIYRERVLTQTFLIFCASLFHQVCIWLILKWDGSAPPAGDAFNLCLHAVSVTTLVGAVVSFFVVRFRRRRFDPATA